MESQIFYEVIAWRHSDNYASFDRKYKSRSAALKTARELAASGEYKMLTFRRMDYYGPGLFSDGPLFTWDRKNGYTVHTKSLDFIW